MGLLKLEQEALPVIILDGLGICLITSLLLLLLLALMIIEELCFIIPTLREKEAERGNSEEE